LFSNGLRLEIKAHILHITNNDKSCSSYKHFHEVCVLLLLSVDAIINLVKKVPPGCSVRNLTCSLSFTD
jgi:hypothetical protein